MVVTSLIMVISLFVIYLTSLFIQVTSPYMVTTSPYMVATSPYIVQVQDIFKVGVFTGNLNTHKNLKVTEIKIHVRVLPAS